MSEQHNTYDCAHCGERVAFRLLGLHADEDNITVECAFCGNESVISIEVKPAGKNRLYLNEEWLRTAYEVENRTMAEIAKQCAVSPMTINRWLNVHGIETRSRGHRQS